ncbi:MAG: hypothetical protein SVW02_01170 [Candidatus Nanohaloarchaea archaeon]|nr:hypothetical protein [Candidatus Nanohaloarchaea archaeon]
MNGLIYTERIDGNADANLDDFEPVSDPMERPPYGGNDSLLRKGERLWLYVLPSQRKAQVRINGTAGRYEPSTEALVCRYLQDEGLFDPEAAPGGERGTLREVWDQVMTSVHGLPEEDRALVDRGADLVDDPDEYYQKLGELCYRNR